MQRAPQQIINDNNCLRIGGLTTNQAVGSSIRDRRSRSTDAAGETVQLPVNLSGRAKKKGPIRGPSS